MRTAVNLLLIIITLLCQRLGLIGNIIPLFAPNRQKNLKGNSTNKSGG
jgi:hypothetical protein